jgi:hypothetical protein
MGFVIGLAWGGALLGCFTGFGVAVHRLLVRDDDDGWAVKSAWGLSLVVVIGGVLNLAGAVSRASVGVLVAVGVALWLWDVAARRAAVADRLRQWLTTCRRDRAGGPQSQKFAIGGPVAWLWSAVFALAAVQLVGSAWSDLFNDVDDYQGYLVFPARMLQTGSMGADPFSERRIVSGLGGQSFLDAMVLTAGHFENLYIIDPGLGVVIAIGVLAGCLRRRGAPAVVAPCLGLVLLLLPAPRINTTAILIPIALFLALFEVLDAGRLDGQRRWANVVVLATVATALGTLKSSLLPAMGVMFIVSYGVYLVRTKEKARAVTELAVLGLLGLAFALPWMLAMKRSSGTLLYPLLGRGYHATAWGQVQPPTQVVADRVPQIVFITVTWSSYLAVAVLTGLAVFRGRKYLGPRAPAVALGVAAMVGGVVTSLAVGGEGHFRYGFPFYTAAMLALLATLLAPRSAGSTAESANPAQDTPPSPAPGTPVAPPAPGIVIACVFVVAFVIGNTWNNCVLYYWDFLHNVKLAAQGGTLTTPAQRDHLRAAQAAVPAGEPLIARVDRPFLLDFARNRVFVPDHPGSASPPPGMPLYQGPDALAQFLLDQHVRYAMYGYGNEAGFTKKQWGFLIEPGNPKVLMGLVGKPLFDYQDNMAALGRTRRRVYDDGQVFVLDLATPSTPAAASGQKAAAPTAKPPGPQ